MSCCIFAKWKDWSGCTSIKLYFIKIYLSQIATFVFCCHKVMSNIQKRSSLLQSTIQPVSCTSAEYSFRKLNGLKCQNFVSDMMLELGDQKLSNLFPNETFPKYSFMTFNILQHSLYSQRTKIEAISYQFNGNEMQSFNESGNCSLDPSLIP